MRSMSKEHQSNVGIAHDVQGTSNGTEKMVACRSVETARSSDQVTGHEWVLRQNILLRFTHFAGASTRRFFAEPPGRRAPEMLEHIRGDKHQSSPHPLREQQRVLRLSVLAPHPSSFRHSDRIVVYDNGLCKIGLFAGLHFFLDHSASAPAQRNNILEILSGLLHKTVATKNSCEKITCCLLPDRTILTLLRSKAR